MAITKESIQQITLEPVDNQQLAKLCGQFDENLSFIEQQLGVEINHRGNQFDVIGIPASVAKTAGLLQQLYRDAATTEIITTEIIQLAIKALGLPVEKHQNHDPSDEQPIIKLKNYQLRARTVNQRHYLRSVAKYDINFGIGPSGTGKTFLAVASAVSALEQESVSRIVLVRPAVEAGESLGFLPGDLVEKIDPYLRPLYDALYEIFGINKVAALLAKGIIEVAPLAYMRGRTLSDSFVILDEAQNTTKEQMKMFLTRIGFGSRAVITGDITQVDLPRKTESGLRHAISLLSDIEGIQFTFFTAEDVVRHPLVQRIIETYDAQDEH